MQPVADVAKAWPPAGGPPPAPARDFSRVPVRSIQRAAADGGPVDQIPPIVHTVLRSPGRPLDPPARAFFEPRFGTDLGQVRIHTDDQAAESARAVRAQAYTVGRDVVMAEGRFAPHTADGRRLLAHELAHTIQQGAAPALAGTATRDAAHRAKAGQGEAAAQGGTPVPGLSRNTSPVVLARQPAPAKAATKNERRVQVDAAAKWLSTLADFVQTLRNLAFAAALTASSDKERPAAIHRYLNQELLGTILGSAVGVFNHVVQMDPAADVTPGLSEAYFRVMDQLGEAMDVAWANADKLPAREWMAERTGYSRNQILWLAASPEMALARGTRRTFTETEVKLSEQRHARVSAKLEHLETNLDEHNLAGTGAMALWLAAMSSTWTLRKDPATGRAAPGQDPDLLRKARPAMDRLGGVRWGVLRAMERLEQAEGRTRAFAMDPGKHPDVGEILNDHFHTTDPGYATLLADRLARMARELRAGDRLALRVLHPNDPRCRGAGRAGFLTGFATRNQAHVCGAPSPGSDAGPDTIIHETAHAVLPGLGAKGDNSGSDDMPVDRAYEWERAYQWLSPEEALANAASYSTYVTHLLAGRRWRLAQRDTVTGCDSAASASGAAPGTSTPAPPSETPGPGSTTPGTAGRTPDQPLSPAERIQAVAARSTALLRFGSGWADQLPTHDAGGNPVEVPEEFLRAAARSLPWMATVGTPADAEGKAEQDARALLGQLKGLGDVLYLGLDFECSPANDPERAGGTLVYTSAYRVMENGVDRTRKKHRERLLRICPAWFQASELIRENALTAMLLLHYRPGIPLKDVFGVVATFREKQTREHPGVTGRSLETHRRADERAAAAPLPAP